MTIVIEIYIIICVALLLFDIIFLWIKNHRTNALYPKNTAFEEQLRLEIEKYRADGTFSEGFADSLDSRLGKIRDLITLVSVLEDKPESKPLFARHIFSQIDTYAKRPQAEQAYYTYVVSLFDYKKEYFPQGFFGKFMDFLDSPSLYTFTNTMNALYHFGQSNLLIQAMEKVNERDRFYHKKLLVDGLLTSNTDFNVLNGQLCEHFHTYTPYMQDCLLDYFRLNSYDVKDLCMTLLKTPETDEQVRYGAMRYLAKFPSAASDTYFLKLLKDENQDWLCQMLAIQGLAHREDPEVRSAIGGKITSPDWYVRVHAAQYLYAHHITEKELTDILEMQDRYATEIITYCCRNDKKLSDHIAKTIVLLKEQERSVHNELQEPAVPALAGKEA